MYKDKWLNYYFPQKTLRLPKKWVLLRALGKEKLSSSAQLKLEWIIAYHSVFRNNAAHTAQHFGISRKTFHKYLKRFDERNLLSLEEHKRIPIKKRSSMITAEEERKIKDLRKTYLTLGKKKLQVLYQQQYGTKISTWKIEQVVRKHQLYAEKITRSNASLRYKNKGKKRIHHLRQEQQITQFGQLWHVDAIVIWWYGRRKIIFTAIDEVTRIAYARIYKTNTTTFAADFLQRLVILSNGTIPLIHSDNGSEFAGLFQQACEQMNISQIYSRAYTPKDNALLERFNRTVQEEWLALSTQGLDDITFANKELTEWLIFYNNIRPHQALDYKTPLAYAHETFFNLLPMWPASTHA